MSVRRAHFAALGCAALLALLLLAALPPAPAPPPPAPAPLLTHSLTAPVNRTSTSAASAPPASASASPPAPPPPRAQQPVLTSELYEAGHSLPHPELCPSLGAPLRLMILVTSAPSHGHARDAIRLTWGHYAVRRDVSLGFFLGEPPPETRKAIQEEDSLYGDLVIGNFVDSYSNLTLKTLSMLEWADAYCPRAPRILKTDDDMFINVPRLLQFLDARKNATMTIWGKVVKKWLPKRTTKSKYYVSPLQFPGKVFPEFATGPAYVVTSDAVRPLYDAALRSRYVRLEDVAVTGLAAAAAKVARRHAPEFANRQISPHACALRRLTAIHMVRYHEQLELWRKLLDDRTKCPN